MTHSRRGLAVVAVACLGLALSGCAYTMGEFSHPSAKPIALAEPAPPDGQVPLKPTALVEESQTAASAEAIPVAAPDPSGFPNINKVPPPPKGKLLTPEEKAKVIAELEALAKSQGAPTVKARKAASAECDAAKTLDPEVKLKREREGLKC